MAPSPFVRNRQAPVQDGQPLPMRPIPDPPVAGVVFPYRGQETHGVNPTAQVTIDPEEADYGTTVAVPYEEKEKEPDPVPVRIVTGDSAGERKGWRVIREYCRAGEGPRQIVPQDEFRTSCKIRNLHASDTLWVSANSFNDTAFGYPIPSGGELSLNATTEVYGRVSAANDIPVAILVETSTPE